MATKRGRKPKTEGEKTSDGRSSPPMSLRMDPEIARAIEAFIQGQKYKTTKTDVIEVALQELLKAEGYWPPKENPASA